MWPILDMLAWLFGDVIIGGIADRFSGGQVLRFIVTLLALAGVALLVWSLWLR